MGPVVLENLSSYIFVHMYNIEFELYIRPRRPFMLVWSRTPSWTRYVVGLQLGFDARAVILLLYASPKHFMGIFIIPNYNIIILLGSNLFLKLLKVHRNKLT